MHRLMHALTEDTVYEGLFRSAEDMKAKVLQETGSDCEVFVNGDCPQNITLTEYREIKDLIGERRATSIIPLVDALIGRYLGDIEAFDSWAEREAGYKEMEENYRYG